jgi:hypothetical protein
MYIPIININLIEYMMLIGRHAQKIACDPKKLSNTEGKQPGIFPRKPQNA